MSPSTGTRRGLLAAAIVTIAPLVHPAVAHAGCTVTVSGINFGTYDVFAASPDDSTGAITYRCTGQDRDLTITLSTGSSSSYAARTMAAVAGADTLTYNLYADANRTSVWGDGSGGSTYYFRRNPQNNRDVIVTVYGRVPAGQDVAVGAYTDTVVVTLDF